MIILHQSNDTADEDFGIAHKYLASISNSDDCPDCAPANVFACLVKLLDNNKTFYADGFSEIITKLCGNGSDVTPAQMHAFVSEKISPQHVWSRSVDLGSEYFMLDFRQV